MFQQERQGNTCMNTCVCVVSYDAETRLAPIKLPLPKIPFNIVSFSYMLT